MKFFASPTLFAFSLVTLAAVGNQANAAKNIVETAVEAGSFQTLATALEAADLVEALQGEGPFTVFAPTDDAFAKLPAATIAELLKPENKHKLAGILTFHVVPGKVLAKDVVKLNGAVTLNGQRVDVKFANGAVTVDGAKVVTTDIKCSNGVIHVIDSVILPASDDLATTAKNAGSFEILLTAAKAAGLVDALKGDGPLTVFAPTDEAFSKLPSGTVETLLQHENRGQLAEILKYHVVAGRLYSEQALKEKGAETLAGQRVRVSVQDGAARVNNAKLVSTDIDASNGVIHVIDSVLLPTDEHHESTGGSDCQKSSSQSSCSKDYVTIRVHRTHH